MTKCKRCDATDDQLEKFEGTCNELLKALGSRDGELFIADPDAFRFQVSRLLAYRNVGAVEALGVEAYPFTEKQFPYGRA